MTLLEAYLPVASARPGKVSAAIGPLGPGSPVVARFVVDPTAAEPTSADGLSEVDADVITRTVQAGLDAGVPVVGVLRGTGGDAFGGVATLHGWGVVARMLTRASGQVPVVLVVDGPCLGGPALLLGLADVVILTDDAVAYVSEPAAVARITAVDVSEQALGGAAVHAAQSGVAHVVAPDLPEALAVAADLLDHLPPNHHEPPPVGATTDPFDRRCELARAAVPTDARQSYDVRDVIADIVDHRHVLELRPRFGASVVTAVARIAGQPVGIVANQPCQLAGALDIEGSQKAARFVRWCDGANLPLVTFVDTPGFRPGKDQEWRGMIRHGAQLAFAYAEATVPRLCVLLRKAYGGAFIVMDCKTMGNDVCFAWPSAEVAVMGAAGAVEVLHRKRLSQLPDHDRDAEHAELVAHYEATHLSPRIAAERGYVDEVIDPADTRMVLARSLAALAAKRESLPRRRHANTPL